ncbi:phage tail sheath subtilisin-like domain-containing protein [Massilia sp. B-10]|nr:phage tail sheath subtilisin-like domain-containing protein [Massilia sp. B-10]
MALIATDNISRAEVVLADLLLVDPPDAAAIAAARTSAGRGQKYLERGGADRDQLHRSRQADREERPVRCCKADLFNMLCIPPYKADGNIDPSLVAEAASYCEHRRAMLMVDPIASWVDKDAAKAGVGSVGTSSKNAALFFPRLKQPNPLRDNQLEDFVPCGAVACIFARTDTTRGVWKAPAGLDATLVAVPQLSVPLTDAENGELNPLGINCLRAMPKPPGAWCGARAPCRAMTAWPRNGNTFRCGARPCSSKRACTAAPSGSCSSRTTNRCGRRSA